MTSLDPTDLQLELLDAPRAVGSLIRDAISQHLLGEAGVDLTASNPPLVDMLDLTHAAAGHDVTPGHDELHHYWVAGPGLAEWKGSPEPYTTLVGLLVEHVKPPKPVEVYHRWAAAWFHEVFGFWPGSDLNRVTHGHPPRGHVVGPG